ncbi:MAG: hypothetical protein E7366_00270 [Clostridiales bacterium]|nr:hypothetical protein [Clostridiales bacterium]
MINFWESSVWGLINLIGVLLLSLVVANMLKRSITFLKKSLIPTSVLGGTILLVISTVYQAITGDLMFNTSFFGYNGMATMEVITYHMLGLGFIASALKISNKKLTKKRAVEVFDSGVTTVATYLLQAVFGLGITMLLALVVTDFFPAAGVLLPFGFGQGTGQALNYGNIYETDYGFVGGRSFGLTIAALGFLSASIGGVIYMNILKRKREIVSLGESEGALSSENVQGSNEIPMNGSIDKLTVQFAFVAIVYVVAYLLMLGLGEILPGMRSVIYGFNFLFGVMIATAFKGIVQFFHKKNIIHRQYVNNFLMNRISGFCFDIMVVAGVAAIRLDLLKQYWWILLILGAVGLVITYIYNQFVAKTLFGEYAEEQFLAMYGMLTGTASTGIILLRELDGEFKTPASDNLVYQTLPAIVFGFPLMLLATLAPKEPMLTWIILFAFFAVMNVILFRSKIFKRKVKVGCTQEETVETEAE